MALEDTITLYRSAGSAFNDGVLVPRNCAQLNNKLDLGALAWDLRDFSSYDHAGVVPFQSGEKAWIGEEIVVVGSGTAITRGDGATSDANHPKGAMVYPHVDNGTTVGAVLLNQTVPAGDAGKTITQVRCGGNAAGRYEVLINGTRVAMSLDNSNYHQSDLLIWSGSILAENDVIKVLCYNMFPEAVFWCEVLI